jgi:hypothetical protein
MRLADAMGAGVKYALGNGIMPDFIRKHSSEVNNMLFVEYDPVEARKVAVEEGYEDGFEDGFEDGRVEIVRRMKRNGRSTDEIIADTDMSAEQVESIY